MKIETGYVTASGAAWAARIHLNTLKIRVYSEPSTIRMKIEEICCEALETQNISPKEAVSQIAVIFSTGILSSICWTL